MYWMRRVRRELLAYNALQADRRELLDQLAEMEDDISPTTSHLDGMPKPQGGLPRSTVESAVIRRMESGEAIAWQLARLDRRIAPIERALTVLEPLEKEVIRRSFLSVDYNDDTDIASSLQIADNELATVKRHALWILRCLIDIHLVAGMKGSA